MNQQKQMTVKQFSKILENILKKTVKSMKPEEAEKMVLLYKSAVQFYESGREAHARQILESLFFLALTEAKRQGEPSAIFFLNNAIKKVNPVQPKRKTNTVFQSYQYEELNKRSFDKRA
jgi:hypothetical protein